MKTIFILLTLNLIIFYSCQNNDLKIIKNQDNQNQDNNYIGPGLRPINIFEGTWLWTKTEGSGIAGPYLQDPSSEGYNLVYYFYNFSSLHVFKNNITESSYSYSFILSDSLNGNILTLTDSAGVKTNYLWNISSSNTDDILTLTNLDEYRDNSFTIYFKRISYLDSQSSLSL